MSSPDLRDVSAASPDSAWAVGTAGGSSLILHWDGSTWARETLPALNPGHELSGVVAISDTEAWAVGSVPNGVNDQTLVLHRVDGTWTRVPSANHNTDQNVLQAIAAVAPDDIWAAGRYRALGNVEVLMEHWNGATWTEVTYPDIGTLDWSHALSASGPDDVWFAGHITAGSSGGQIGHWNGGSWSAEDAALDVNGIAARTANDVWAVGADLGADGSVTWTRHLVGGEWTEIPGADIDVLTSSFDDVSNDAPTGAWAVGTYYTDQVYPLIEHWGGDAWTPIAAPSVSNSGQRLLGVASAGGRLFAVGQSQKPLILSTCPIRVTAAGFSTDAAIGGIGDSVTWTVPRGEAGSPRVVDASGFELFDSGPLGAGDALSFAYTAAGDYAVTDQATDATGTVSVPVLADPPKGPRGSRFQIRWSSATPPAGTVFDVQIQRPGGLRFTSWKSGTTSLFARFLPDAGTGPYFFRARVRNATTTSGWSASTRIRVTN
jgi:hypothetical protein